MRLFLNVFTFFTKCSTARANPQMGVCDDGRRVGVPLLRGRTATREWLEQIIPYLLSYPLQVFRVHEVTPTAPSATPPPGQVGANIIFLTKTSTVQDHRRYL